MRERGDGTFRRWLSRVLGVRDRENAARAFAECEARRLTLEPVVGDEPERAPAHEALPVNLLGESPHARPRVLGLVRGPARELIRLRARARRNRYTAAERRVLEVLAAHQRRDVASAFG